VLHPLSATVLAVFVLWMLLRRATNSDPVTRRLALSTLGLLVLQYALGIADIFLLAPLWLQILHLLGADLFWIALVLLLARSLPRRAQVA
jgi:cytochrome c oxidase assembly protein subunit 15